MTTAEQVSDLRSAPDIMRFAGLTLDIGRGRLFGEAGDVPLRPKSFALLCYMARHPGQVLTKDALMAAVWPGVFVSDDSLTQCVRDVRRALGLAGDGLLRTVPRRGYLFAAPTAQPVPMVAAPADAPYRWAWQSPSPSRDTPDQSRSVGDRVASKPGSIAVLPFDCAPSVQPDDRMWFDGVVHDVISQLARLRSFDVIARGSTFALRHLAGDPVRAGQTLGAAYVLIGSITKRGREFVVRSDLVRTDEGAAIWADEVALDSGDFLGLVSTLTDRIVALVLSGIATTERNLARLVPDGSLTAWQAYHRGLDDFFIYSEASLNRARGYFALATELDPGFVRAFAALSECHAELSRTPFCKDMAAEAAASLHAAERAMHLDEMAPSAQFSYGHARWLHGEPEVALSYARQSVALSPSFADGYDEIGRIEAVRGDPENALAALARSEVLSPYSPFLDSVYLDRAIAHLQRNDIDEAARWASSAANRPASYPQMQATCATVLAAAGRTSEARRIVQALHRDAAQYDPMRLFKAPFNLRGPAREKLFGAVTKIGL